MARKDARALRDEVASAIDRGKFKRAIECILELEHLEPQDASWPKRAAEVYRRLGKTREAISAYERAAERYAQGGFLVQAIAVSKQILQLDPQHSDTLRRIAAMAEERRTGPVGMRAINVAGDAIPELIVGRATGPMQRVDPATLVPDDRELAMLDVPDRRSRPLSMPVVSMAPPPPESEPEFSDLELPDAPVVASAPLPKPPVAASDPVPVPAPAPASPPSPPPSTPAPRFKPGSVMPPLGVPSIGTRPPPLRATSPLRATTPPPIPPIPPIPPSSLPPPPAPPRNRRSSPPPISSRRRRPDSAPVMLEPGAALDTVPLGSVMPGAEIERNDDGLSSGIIVIPLEDVDDGTGPIELLADEPPEDTIEVPLDDVETPIPIEDIHLRDPITDDEMGGSPRSLSLSASRALRSTPLLAGLDGAQLEALVEQLELIHLDPGQILFREGDQGDTLFIVSEGEVAVISEGPPRKELSRLLPGAFFGEIALITDQPRTATIAAVLRTELLAIDRDVVRALVNAHPDSLRIILRFIKNRLVERVVQTSPLFVPFADHDRRALADRFEFLEVEPGTRLVTQGVRPDGLYVILAGTAVAQRDLEGATRILGPLGSGEVFGEMALYGAELAVATILAKSKVLALRIPAGDFRDLIMTHPQVLAFVGELAETRRRQAENPEDSGDVVDLKLDML